VELFHIYDVDTSKFGVIRDAAESVPVEDQYPGYSCQDYVSQPLDDLESKEIIDENDADYGRRGTQV
jgi:hypothetical protein